MARLAESISHQPTRVLNTDATNKAEDADAAWQEIGADIVAYGEFTSTVTVWDADASRAEDKLKLVMQAFETHGRRAARRGRGPGLSDGGPLVRGDHCGQRARPRPVGAAVVAALEQGTRAAVVGRTGRGAGAQWRHAGLRGRVQAPGEDLWL
jgi:hypothetical protein